MSYRDCIEKDDLRTKALLARNALMEQPPLPSAGAATSWVALATDECFTLAPGSLLRFRWFDPDVFPNEATVPKHLFRSDKIDGASAGTHEFAYYDPASVAMELHSTVSRNSCEDFRVADGSLIYFAGTSYWGSALLHFATSGSCAPPSPPDARIGKWGDTAPYRGMATFATQLESMMNSTTQPLPGSAISMQHHGHTLLDPGRSQAHCITVQLKEKATRELPWLYDNRHDVGDPLPQNKDEIPSWWETAVSPWDRVMQRMFDGGAARDSLPCQFFATSADPRGAGCKTLQCAFCHDTWWLEWDRDMRANPRVCVCGAFAEERCTSCVKSWFCGQCPKTLGVVRCPVCVRANKPALVARSTVGAGEHDRLGTAQPKPGSNRETVRDTIGPDWHTTGRPQCGFCGKVEGELLKCSGCKNTVFCSTPCPKKVRTK
jgi:hypothetical protein